MVDLVYVLRKGMNYTHILDHIVQFKNRDTEGIILLSDDGI